MTWGLPSPGRPFSEARARQRRHGHRRSPTDRQHGHALKSLSPTTERRPPTLIADEDVSAPAFAETVESELCYDI
jgi:hypothetical protein